MRTGAERLSGTDTTTRERIRSLVAEHPEYTLADLGRELGVSRERARQLVQSEGLTIRQGYRGVGERATPQSRAQTGGVALPITHTVAGTIGELLAAADLMTRGYTVYAPIARAQAAYDLIALRRGGGTLETIEVRCGHRSGKRIVFTRPARHKPDRYAVVITGEPIQYIPPFVGDST